MVSSSLGDNKTRVCGGASVACQNAAKKKFITGKSGLKFHSKCNCLQACFSVEYKADIKRLNKNILNLKKG